jgi:methionyl-tRNA synthetase
VAGSAKVLESSVKGGAFLTGSTCTSADIVIAAWAAGDPAGSKLPKSVQTWIKSVIGDAPVTATTKSSGGGGAAGGGAASKGPPAKKVAAAADKMKSTHGTWGSIGDVYYVTTAINYTNGDPHVGHAYEGITADAIGRYHRNYGRDTFFMTGTDEHGKKIAESAEKRSIKEKRDVQPIDICNEYSGKFQELNARLSVQPDFFIRTTMDAHKKSAQELWKICAGKGDMFLNFYEGWYDIGEEQYVTDAEAEALNYKDKSGRPLDKMKEESYFFKMSAYGDQLIKYIEDNATFIQPEEYRQTILKRLREDPLRDLSCSRSNFKWGIPVPGDDKHVMYVWFDALSNYISGIELLKKGKNAKYWPAQCQIIGKDIVWFHCVIWPCMLMSAGIPLPKTVFAHGFVQDKAGAKMSKSIGNVVDPNDMLEKYSSDTLRYFLIHQARYGQDIKFSETDLIAKNNSELADIIGNLVFRAANLAVKYCDSKVPPVSCTDRPMDVADMVTRIDAHFAVFELKEACAVAVDGFRQLNLYFTEKEPWKLKGDEHAATRQMIVRTVLEGIYVCAHLLEPFLPTTGSTLFEMLGTPKMAIKSLSTEFDNLKAGAIITKGEILFKKIDMAAFLEEEVAKEKAAAATAAAAAAPAGTAGLLDGPALQAKIDAQGLVVRDLKSKGQQKDKDAIKAAVGVLLELKKLHATVTGEAAPAVGKAPATKKAAAATAPAAAASGLDGPAILAKVAEQGLVVRELKGAKAAKDQINAAVGVLLALKTEYKTVTGKDVPKA